EPLKTMWEASDCICSQRLHDFMPEWIEALSYHEELNVEVSVKQLWKQALYPNTCGVKKRRGQADNSSS
ncbi:MAG: hypothetical protein PHV74_15620, partial [Dehalococcoidia bacterium]|nr:hypothetical protein [Dehalococcoidia bacterium]